MNLNPEIMAQSRLWGLERASRPFWREDNNPGKSTPGLWRKCMCVGVGATMILFCQRDTESKELLCGTRVVEIGMYTSCIVLWLRSSLVCAHKSCTQSSCNAVVCSWTGSDFCLRWGSLLDEDQAHLNSRQNEASHCFVRTSDKQLL